MVLAGRSLYFHWCKFDLQVFYCLSCITGVLGPMYQDLVNWAEDIDTRRKLLGQEFQKKRIEHLQLNAVKFWPNQEFLLKWWRKELFCIGVTSWLGWGRVINVIDTWECHVWHPWTPMSWTQGTLHGATKIGHKLFQNCDVDQHGLSPTEAWSWGDQINRRCMKIIQMYQTYQIFQIY